MRCLGRRIVNQFPSLGVKLPRKLAVFPIGAHGLIVSTRIQHRSPSENIVAAKKKFRISHQHRAPLLRHVRCPPAIGNRSLHALAQNLCIVQTRLKLLEPRRLRNAIGVQRCYKLASRHAKRGVTGSRQPAISLVAHNRHPRITLSDARRIILRAVVDHQYFRGRQRLRKQALNRPWQKLRHIVCRDVDRDVRHSAPWIDSF